MNPNVIIPKYLFFFEKINKKKINKFCLMIKSKKKELEEREKNQCR